MDLGHNHPRERWRRRSLTLPAHENLGIEAAIARLRAAAPHPKTERMLAPRKKMSARKRRELEHKAAIHENTRWFNVHKKVAPVFFDEAAQSAATKLFNMLDADGGGDIDVSEFTDALHFCGEKPIAADIKELVRLGDQDDNGSIDCEEFIAMMCNPNTLVSMESGALAKSIPPLSLWMLTYKRKKQLEGATVPMLRKWMREEAAEVLAKSKSDAATAKSKQPRQREERARAALWGKNTVSVVASAGTGGGSSGCCGVDGGGGSSNGGVAAAAADSRQRTERSFSEELNKLIDGTTLDTLDTLGLQRKGVPAAQSPDKEPGLLQRVQAQSSAASSAPRARVSVPRSLLEEDESRAMLHDRRTAMKRKVNRLRAKQTQALISSPTKPTSVAAQARFLDAYCGMKRPSSRAMYDAKSETQKSIAEMALRNQNVWCASPFTQSGRGEQGGALWSVTEHRA